MRSISFVVLVMLLCGYAQGIQSELDDGVEWVATGSDSDGSVLMVNFLDGMTGEVIVSSDGHWVKFITPASRYFDGAWGNKTNTIGTVTINGSRSDGREILVVGSQSQKIEIFDDMVGIKLTENTTGQFFRINVAP